MEKRMYGMAAAVGHEQQQQQEDQVQEQQQRVVLGLLDIAGVVSDLVLSRVSIADIARCCCVCRDFRRLSQDALASRLRVTTKDVISSSTTKSLSALRLVAGRCKKLQELCVCLPTRGWASNIILEPMVLFAQRASYVVKLSLINVDVSDRALTLIASTANNLQQLELGSTEHDLPNCSVGDDGLVNIAHSCTNITGLAFLRCHSISDKTLKAFARYNRPLTSIRLHACPEISSEGIIAIAEGCRQLKVLDLVAVRHFRSRALVDHDVAAALGSNTSGLQEVRLCEEALGASLIDDSCLAPLVTGCPGLRTVELHGVDVSDEALILMGGSCHQLECLILKNTWVTYRGIDAIVNGCQCLNSLVINGCWVRTLSRQTNNGDESWAAPLMPASSVFPPIMKCISLCCQNLVRLELSDLDTHPVDTLMTLLEVPFLLQLEILSLKWSRLCEPIAAGSKIDEVMSGVMERCISLQAMNMEGYPGSLDQVLQSAYRSMPRLHIVEIPSTKVTDNGLKVLAMSGLKLTKINLSCCHSVKECGLVKIVKAMESTLKDINLYGVDSISDDTISAILGCRELEYINVGRGPEGNGITGEGLKQLRRVGNIRGVEIDVLPRQKGQYWCS